MGTGSDGQTEQMMAQGGLLPDSSLRLLPTAACVCDFEGRVLQFNDKAVALWGRSPEAGDT